LPTASDLGAEHVQSISDGFLERKACLDSGRF
jgi:hypothetical protein